MATSTQISLDAIPAEVLQLEIFPYLSNSDLLAVSQVCQVLRGSAKRYCRVASSIVIDHKALGERRVGALAFLCVGEEGTTCLRVARLINAHVMSRYFACDILSPAAIKFLRHSPKLSYLFNLGSERLPNSYLSQLQRITSREQPFEGPVDVLASKKRGGESPWGVSWSTITALSVEERDGVEPPELSLQEKKRIVAAIHSDRWQSRTLQKHPLIKILRGILKNNPCLIHWYLFTFPYEMDSIILSNLRKCEVDTLLRDSDGNTIYHLALMGRAADGILEVVNQEDRSALSTVYNDEEKAVWQIALEEGYDRFALKFVDSDAREELARYLDVDPTVTDADERTRLTRIRIYQRALLGGRMSLVNIDASLVNIELTDREYELYFSELRDARGRTPLHIALDRIEELDLGGLPHIPLVPFVSLWGNEKDLEGRLPLQILVQHYLSGRLSLERTEKKREVARDGWVGLIDLRRFVRKMVVEGVDVSLLSDEQIEVVLACCFATKQKPKGLMVDYMNGALNRLGGSWRSPQEGWSLLHIIAKFGRDSSKWVKKLESKGLIDDINATDRDGVTPLMYAAAGASSQPRGKTKLLAALLDMGADLEARDYEGQTALACACWQLRNENPVDASDYDESAELPPGLLSLVKAGADLTVSMKNGEPVMTILSRMYSWEYSAEYSDESDSDSSDRAISEAEVIASFCREAFLSKTEDGDTIFHRCCDFSSLDAIGFGIALKISPNLLDHNGKSPIDRVLAGGVCGFTVPSLAFLIRSGGNVSSDNLEKYPYIIHDWIAREERPLWDARLFESLQEGGWALDTTGREGLYLPQLLIKRSSLQDGGRLKFDQRSLLAELLKHAPLLPLDPYGGTKIHYQVAFLPFSYSHTFDPEVWQGRYRGLTPLHLLAASQSRLDLAGLDLIAESSFPNVNAPVEPDRSEPAYVSDDLIAQQLGSSPFEQIHPGDTALHIAVRVGNSGLAEALLHGGADSTIPNEQGETAEKLMRVSTDHHFQRLATLVVGFRGWSV